MSVNQERIFLSDESERFFITPSRDTTYFTSVEEESGGISDQFWIPVSNPINELVLETPGIMPWKSKTGHPMLPLGLSIAIRDRLRPWSMYLKLVLDKEARQRFLALVFAIFGNTTSTKDMLQAVVSRYPTTSSRAIMCDLYRLSRYSRNVWSDLTRVDTHAPKINDIDNAPIPWSEDLESKVARYIYSRANMCISDIENEDLFTKFTACKMYPELAGEILKNVPRYVKGNSSDVTFRLQTNFYYKFLAIKYGLEIPSFTWQEFSSDEYAKYNLGMYRCLTQIAMGEYDCAGSVKSYNMPQEMCACYNLGAWYRRLRGEMLVLNDVNCGYSQLVLLNRLMRTLGAVMNSGSKLEAEVLVDYVDAVVRENNLSSVLSAFSESCHFDSNSSYDLVQNVDVPATLLRDTENALDEYVQFITNKDNVVQCFTELAALQRNVFRSTPFRRQTAGAFMYHWDKAGMNGLGMLSLVTNKFPMLSSIYGSQQSMNIESMRRDNMTDSIPRRYSVYEMNVNYCKEWDRIHEITSELNHSNQRIYCDSKFVMVLARSLFNDIQRFYRLNSTKSREELLEMAKSYQDNYEGLEDAVRDAVPDYNNGYLEWYTERFAY